MNQTLTYYTNEATPEELQYKPRFTTDELAEFDEATRLDINNHMNKNKEYCNQHPITAIYRMACVGSQTKFGGVIQNASKDASIPLNDGTRARIATVGDTVVYPDGTTAKIISGAGKDNGPHFALVGSHLDNGDEIINTPQNRVIYTQRKGVSLPVDFLVKVEEV